MCLDHDYHRRAAVRPATDRLPHVRRNRVLCDDDYGLSGMAFARSGYHLRCWHLSAHHLPDNLPHPHVKRGCGSKGGIVRYAYIAYTLCLITYRGCGYPCETKEVDNVGLAKEFGGGLERELQ
jgi:hypothetical protein